MTPDRAAVGLLALAVAWLVYRDVAAEREYREDRADWLSVMETY